jgi:hypothetical protein
MGVMNAAEAAKHTANTNGLEFTPSAGPRLSAIGATTIAAALLEATCVSNAVTRKTIPNTT